jgi:predicted phage-related endonuclease
MNINDIMKELAQYKRLQDETAAIIEGLTDQLKEYMTANQLDTLTGDEHKATYKIVTSSRIDTTALKKAMPEVVTAYTKTTETRRFTFA